MIKGSFYGGFLELRRQERKGILDGVMSKEERHVEISTCWLSLNALRG